MKKRQQAASKLVDCDICWGKFFARGLVSHKRLAHGIKVKIITQVKTKGDLSQISVTQVNKADDLSHTLATKVVNADLSQPLSPFMTKDNADESRSHIDLHKDTYWWNCNLMIWEPKYVDCYRCGVSIELLVRRDEQDSFMRESKVVVCDRCIRNFYDTMDGNRIRYKRYDKYGRHLHDLRWW